jgi:hypothetical protein
MTIQSTNRLIYELRRLIGLVLARGRLHRIRTVCVDGAQVIMKSRRCGSGFVVPLGNLFLFLEGSDVEILPEREWLQWELAVDAATSGDCIFRSYPVPHNHFRGLLSRKCPGQPLREILVDVTWSLDQKLAAIRWALYALYQLHRQRANWGNGNLQSISHGDATADNVIVSIKSKSARWIDFDTRHRSHFSEIDRRADDLRALLFSSAACLPPTCYGCLAHTFMSSHSDEQVLNRLRERLLSDWRKLNTYQLAQAPLSWVHADSLSQLLLSIS